MGWFQSLVDSFKLPTTLVEENKIAMLEKELEQARAQNTKSAKEIATEQGEPYVNVDAVNVEKANPRYGSFSLDWNDAFIAQLKATGYVGDSDEAIVEQWFQDVCRHVVLETYEQEQADIADAPNVVRYIDRRPTADGKTIVS